MHTHLLFSHYFVNFIFLFSLDNVVGCVENVNYRRVILFEDAIFALGAKQKWHHKHRKHQRGLYPFFFLFFLQHDFLLVMLISLLLLVRL